MIIIQEPRIYDVDTSVKYKLNRIRSQDVTSALTTCYLIATNKGLNLDFLFVEREGSSNRKVLSGTEFFEKFKLLPDFVNEYKNNYRTWHIQMSKNDCPISFNMSGCGMEIDCMYHHASKVDVDKFIETIEEETVNEIEK